MVRIGSVTAVILLTLSLCGGGCWWIKVIFVSNLAFIMLCLVELRLSWGCDNKDYIKGWVFTVITSVFNLHDW